MLFDFDNLGNRGLQYPHIAAQNRKPLFAKVT